MKLTYEAGAYASRKLFLEKIKMIVVISIYLSLKLLRNKIKFITLPKSERNIVKVILF